MWPFLDKNGQIWTKMTFPEKRDLSVFKYSNYLPSCQKPEKINVSFLRKILNCQINGQTDHRTNRKTWFCKTLCKAGVQLLRSNFKFILLHSLCDTANFIFLQPEWAHPFMTMPIPIFFNQLLISMNLYQHAKTLTFSSFCSRDIVDLKIE